MASSTTAGSPSKSEESTNASALASQLATSAEYPGISTRLRKPKIGNERFQRGAVGSLPDDAQPSPGTADPFPRAQQPIEPLLMMQSPDRDHQGGPVLAGPAALARASISGVTYGLATVLNRSASFGNNVRTTRHSASLKANTPDASEKTRE